MYNVAQPGLVCCVAVSEVMKVLITSIYWEVTVDVLPTGNGIWLCHLSVIFRPLQSSLGNYSLWALEYGAHTVKKKECSCSDANALNNKDPRGPVRWGCVDLLLFVCVAVCVSERLLLGILKKN